MKLLLNERQWKRWLITHIGMYTSEVADGQGYAHTPPTFPCYGYAVVGSFAYEELAPRYLSREQVLAMCKKIEVAHGIAQKEGK